MNLSRRQSLGLLAGAVITPTVVVGAGPIVAAATKMTPQERYDYHLAEMQKAAEEMDPLIAYWHQSGKLGDAAETVVAIYAHRITGRYQGDGMYQGSEENWNGSRTEYNVRLLGYRMDDERMFEVTCPGERLILMEHRLEAFIGRKIGGLLV